MRSTSRGVCVCLSYCLCCDAVDVGVRRAGLGRQKGRWSVEDVIQRCYRKEELLLTPFLFTPEDLCLSLLPYDRSPVPAHVPRVPNETATTRTEFSVTSKALQKKNNKTNIKNFVNLYTYMFSNYQLARSCETVREETGLSLAALPT